jgi:hypothetical protein
MRGRNYTGLNQCNAGRRLLTVYRQRFNLRDLRRAKSAPTEGRRAACSPERAPRSFALESHFRVTPLPLSCALENAKLVG